MAAPRGFNAFYTGPVPDNQDYALISAMSLDKRLPTGTFIKGGHDYRKYTRECVKEQFVGEITFCQKKEEAILRGASRNIRRS